jgi:hypothetical protein
MQPHDACHIALCLAAQRGWHLFACRDDKRPACPHGFKDASNDPDQITELWRRWPGVLIGVATGAVSGVDLLDIDIKHATANVWWRANHLRIPLTETYRSRGGGLHLYFQHHPGLRCSTGRKDGRLPLGVDVRADGGYLIHWYSAGCECLDESPPAPWPPWLINLLLPPAVSTASREPRSPSPDRAIEGLLRHVERAREGNRNSALHWSACRMAERIRAGEISTSKAERDLLAAALTTGLGEIEAKATIKSGLGTQP